MPDPEETRGTDDAGDTEGSLTIERVTHGEPFIDHPYLGSGLGVLAALVTGIILLVSGVGLVASIVAAVVGAIVGGIAGFVIVLVAMSFSAEQAGYGREMQVSTSDEPSLGYRVLGWLYLPLPPVLGIAATLLVSDLLG
jgi:hypothetical protein